MGFSYHYICSCGYQKYLVVGVGFGYLSHQAELNAEIRAGKYGQELVQLAEKYPLGIFDASCASYRCDSCGYLESEYCLDVYENLHPEAHADEIRSRSAWFSPEDGWHMVHERNHRCCLCGNTMRRLRGGETLPCPDCGKELQFGPGICWD